jgi:membrane-bound lytic murein transglycosylase D
MAAAMLLRENYDELGTWPLAITAYNHGTGGMKQAVATVGTTDFGTVVQYYRGPLFGFASRNFYAEFVAVLDIVKNYKHYFGDFPLHRPLYSPPPASTVEVRVRPEMQPEVRRPTMVEVRAQPEAKPTSTTASPPVPVKEYRVRRGDTLFSIAQRFDTSVATISTLNDLGKRRTIKPGQVLALSRQSQQTVAAVATPGRLTVEPVAYTAKASPAASSVVHTAVLREFSRTSTLPPAGAVASQSSSAEVRLAEAAGRLQVKQGTIQVLAQEQLSHYADWLNLPVQRLRTLNRLSPRQQLSLGTKVRLDFSKVSEALFTRRRLQYHRGIEDEFLRAYRVGGVATHTVRPGETLWTLAQQKDVPVWLLQRYNEHLQSAIVRPGTKLRIPKVVVKSS